MTRWVIREPVFTSEFHVYRGSYEVYRKRLKIPGDPTRPEPHARYDDQRRFGGDIWFHPTVKGYSLQDIATVSHECTHATTAMFNSLCMRLCDANDELFCYFQDWLLHEVLERLRK